MRWLLLAVALGAAGCGAMNPPPASGELTDWRTLSGERLSKGEVEALAQSCTPRIVPTAVNPQAGVASPQSVNPAYRPGGVGLMSATPTGIAGIDAPVGVGTVAVKRGAARPLDECLEGKGLVRVP